MPPLKPHKQKGYKNHDRLFDHAFSWKQTLAANPFGPVTIKYDFWGFYDADK